MARDQRQVLLVTGFSGAGLSTALKGLEDLGWKAVDNLPLSLAAPLLADPKGKNQAVAIGIDSRTWDFSAPRFKAELEELKKNPDLAVRLLFIDCVDGVLQQRFTETRRRHPLACDRPIADGVARERALLEPLRHDADLVVDTSDLSVRDLRRIVAGQFKLEEGHGLLVYITSFGFRYGLPREADMVFDVRFLDNPHYDLALRPLTGKDKSVGDRIKSDSGYAAFFTRLTGFVQPLLDRFAQEGRSYLTIAVGCTGGRHRSVFVAEELFSWLDKNGSSVGLRHRDLERWAADQKNKDNKQEKTKERA